MIQASSPKGRPFIILGVFDMSDRELAAKFRGSAVEFQRLNPIDVFLLVRRVADPVESNDVATQTLIDQNKLRDRFGQVHSCSVVAVGDEWEQCILFVDLTSNITRRAFGDWQEAASNAAGLCQAANISPLFNRGHDSIVEFVMALESELHNRNRTEFVDLFKEKKGFESDLTKGILTSIEDTPKKSARLMEEYATRLAESSAVDAPRNQEPGESQAEDWKLNLARTWIEKPRKQGGPTDSQKRFIEAVVDKGGSSSHADICTLGKFDAWEDVRKCASSMAKRINERLLTQKELWSLIPEDNGKCLIVLNSELNSVPK
jgi:hypothetical protein